MRAWLTAKFEEIYTRHLYKEYARMDLSDSYSKIISEAHCVWFGDHPLPASVWKAASRARLIRPIPVLALWAVS